MRRLIAGRKKWVIAGAALLLIAGLVPLAWVKRTEILAWYYVQRLASADEAHRAAWIDDLLALGEPAVPRLIACLAGHDPKACANARAALLQGIAQADESQRVRLARQLAESFCTCSTSGQPVVLALQTAIVERGDREVEQVISVAVSTLTSAQHSRDKEVLAEALCLARTLVTKTREPDVRAACRELVRLCIRSDHPENRADALQLALHPDVHLLQEVLVLLDDPSPEVRRMTVVALGPSEQAIGTEDLLRWLHDPDPEMRLLCQSALRGRNLSENQIRLGRTLTDPRASVRLQTVDALRRSPDLVPGVWLRRLSHDPEPAVRSAAIRAAAEHPFVHFADRLE